MTCGEREEVHVNPILHSLAKGSRVKFTFFYIKEGLSSVVLRSVKRKENNYLLRGQCHEK